MDDDLYTKLVLMKSTVFSLAGQGCGTRRRIRKGEGHSLKRATKPSFYSSCDRVVSVNSCSRGLVVVVVTRTIYLGMSVRLVLVLILLVCYYCCCYYCNVCFTYLLTTILLYKGHHLIKHPHTHAHTVITATTTPTTRRGPRSRE